MKCYWKNIKCTKGLFCNGCKHQPPDDKKKNGKEPPKEVTCYDYGAPMCPSCNEPTYSDDRCVFCGQKLVFPEQEEPKTEITGGHIDENGDIVCDKCGSAKLSVVVHADGQDFFINTFNCENGHCIKLKQWRRG